jgi:hypothetical protein
MVETISTSAERKNAGLVIGESELRPVTNAGAVTLIPHPLEEPIP